jgi:hypothetical protein
MWLPLITTSAGAYAWFVYEQAAKRIAESERIKKKIPTRQVSMEEIIYDMQGRRMRLEIFLVVDALLTLSLWAHYLWG